MYVNGDNSVYVWVFDGHTLFQWLLTCDVTKGALLMSSKVEVVIVWQERMNRSQMTLLFWELNISAWLNTFFFSFALKKMFSLTNTSEMNIGVDMHVWQLLRRCSRPMYEWVSVFSSAWQYICESWLLATLFLNFRGPEQVRLLVLLVPDLHSSCTAIACGLSTVCTVG